MSIEDSQPIFAFKNIETKKIFAKGVWMQFIDVWDNLNKALKLLKKYHEISSIFNIISRFKQLKKEILRWIIFDR